MTPQEKRKQTLINKFGSEEAYLEYMRGLGSKGGKNVAPEHRYFSTHKESARKAGSLGGKEVWRRKHETK